MIRNAAELDTRAIEIDLTGSNGNAFVLLGTARRLCLRLGYDDIMEDVLTEMRSGDYENLVNVFDEYFGDFVTLYR